MCIGATGVTYAHYGQGAGPVLMSYVSCSSSSYSLLGSSCYYYRYDYSHYFDLGVQCQCKLVVLIVTVHAYLSYSSVY